MPVAIACPKCQTRYSLPDQALGKPVKCKSCGAVFKTNAPKAPATQQPPSQQPAQRAAQPPAQRAAQAPNAELAKYGIDGPIGRPADIFAGAGVPPAQMGNPLGNFVLEDPGFADLNVVHEAVQEEMSHDDGMAGIINNPYLTSSKSSAKGRKKAAPVDVSGYSVARVGMWMVYVSWGLLLGITVFFALFLTMTTLVPQETLRSIFQSLGPTFGQILLWIFTVFSWIGFLSFGVVFIGQILCIFAPNKDERLFAGLTVGSIVAAFVTFIALIFLGIFAAVVGRDQEAAQAGFGILILLGIFGIYLLILASMFFFMTYFKRIGKNIGAKTVMDAAKTATLTWISAIAIGIISSVGLSILPMIVSADGGWLFKIQNIFVLVNVYMTIGVMGTLLVMVRKTIDRTRAN